MPREIGIRKVMVIGSGPIVIGQAAEFDYSGSQACRALREEGVEVVLVNSNPATIMTDADMADKVYIEPLTVESLKAIAEKERPDGILPTLGGQTGLNAAAELFRTGILAELGIKLLGTKYETIEKAEDRQQFKNLMVEIGEPVLDSNIASTVDEAIEIADSIGYPVIVRPAYTMGGAGGGVAVSQSELQEIVAKGFRYSRIGQVLVEKSVKGWKEIEYEVVRDKNDNCIVICNMENFDPVGVHTGDSIVVAPSQTLSDKEYQMLRSSAVKIVRALGVEGGCNVQYALDPASMQYYLIEVNPRVSRSSALASKATGYPIAKVTTKIALGYSLDEIENSVTKKTACFEPALDYVVFKIPRWPFDKFAMADRKLGTQMKATGEVMSIARTLEAAILKAVRSLELDDYGFQVPQLVKLSDKQLEEKIYQCDDQKIFAVVEALRREWGVKRLHRITHIDIFFLHKLEQIVEYERRLKQENLTEQLLQEVKEVGFADAEIAVIVGCSEDDILKLRTRQNIKPSYKMVDTCAGEFEAHTPYYYSTYEPYNDCKPSDQRKVVVLGSGPIRIGQGIEFDYCSVHAVWALKEEGYESITINNNPETVSTDFDTADRLYFEPLTTEDVLHIMEHERPEGVVVQFGGQTAINLAAPLAKKGVKILGTSVDSIDLAEDRDRFLTLTEELGIPTPLGGTAREINEAMTIAKRIKYPVLVRPSYVLGGRAMEVVHDEQELEQYMLNAVNASREHPILIDKFINGKELEVDAISDGHTVFIPGIMEHIEAAGVHSGDSIAVYPTQTIQSKLIGKVEDYTIKIARAIGIKGLVNIQFVVTEDEVYVLEVNPRSSRTVPYLSKVTGIPMVKLATQCMLGHKLTQMGYHTGRAVPKDIVAVKVPVFSFSKLRKVDTFLSPEMKSTGEVLGIGRDYSSALYKGLLAAGLEVPSQGSILATIADQDKKAALPYLREFKRLGFNLLATTGTAAFLQQAGVSAISVDKVSQGSPNVIDLIRRGKVDLVINTLTKGKLPQRDGYQIRRNAVEMNIPCLTSLDTVGVLLKVIRGHENLLSVEPLQDYVSIDRK